MRTQGIGGYTLIDALVTIVILGILCNLCINAFSSTIARNHRNLAMQVVLTTLDCARLLAVMEAKPVGVCLLDAESNCDENWTGGDLGIFIDANKNRHRDRNESVRFRQPWPTRDITLRWANNFNSEPTITYQANGSVTSNGTLRFLDKSNHVIQSVVISKTGRARIE